MQIQRHHIVPNKRDYARGSRPPVDCILCAVWQGDAAVDKLIVHRTQKHFVTLNLYPYNPGHLMVVPAAHVTDPRDLSEDSVLTMQRLACLSMDVLEQHYQAHGFNWGYNIGPSSGASIPHLHLQIVPRYPTEIGFFDTIGDSRVIVEAPDVTLDRLSRAFAATGAASSADG